MIAYEHIHFTWCCWYSVKWEKYSANKISAGNVSQHDWIFIQYAGPDMNPSPESECLQNPEHNFKAAVESQAHCTVDNGRFLIKDDTIYHIFCLF